LRNKLNETLLIVVNQYIHHL